MVDGEVGCGEVAAVVVVVAVVNDGGTSEGALVVVVVMAGSVRVTHSSRHSPCSCQSQSTTKSGTVKKGGLEEEKERRSGRRVLDMN